MSPEHVAQSTSSMMFVHKNDPLA